MSTSRPRQESASRIYHVMNRGIDHQMMFFTDQNRREFCRLLAWIREHLDVTVLAYCLMDNHYHLLLWAPDQATLSKAMQHLGSVYTRRTNRLLGRDGALCRGRFHSIPVETDSYLLTASRYVHLNPLDIPGVTSPSDHAWSSYGAYLGLEPAPAFLDTEPVMALLAHDRDQLVALTEGGLDGRRVPAAAADVRAITAWAVAVEDLACIEINHPQGVIRTTLAVLADRSTDPALLHAIACELGPRTIGAEAAAQRRAMARFAVDPVVQRVVARVEAELAPPCNPRRLIA